MKTLRYMIILMLLSITTQVFSLGGVVLSVAYWQCESTGFPSYSPVIYVNINPTQAGGDQFDVHEYFWYRIYDGNGDILADAGYDYSFGVGAFDKYPFSMPISHLPVQEPITIEVIDMDINWNPTSTWSIQADNPCNDESVVDTNIIQPDLSIGTAMTAYGNQFGWTFYSIDDLGNGYLSLVVYEDILSQYVDSTETLWVAGTGDVQLYRLSTGYWQINLKATEAGLITSIVFDTLPPNEVYNMSYNIYD